MRAVEQSPLSVPMRWRVLLRESELPSRAKLVGFCLSIYMDTSGRAGVPGNRRRPGPSRETLAAGCSVTDRTVDKGLAELEDAGLLDVMRSTGGARRTNYFQAVVAVTANELRGCEDETANDLQIIANLFSTNGERASQEVVSTELELRAEIDRGKSRAPKTKAREPGVWLVDECFDCGKWGDVYDEGHRQVCAACRERPAA